MKVTSMIGRPFLVTVLASVFVLGALEAQAQEKCSNASYQGVYGYTGNGFNPAGPFAFVGRFTADGNGNIVGSQTNNGQTGRFDFTETYTVNPDCTGSSTKTLPNGATHHFDFVILHGGGKIRSIETGNLAILTVIADRDSRDGDSGEGDRRPK